MSALARGPYRARGPSRLAGGAHLRPRPDLTRATRLAGAALLFDAAWLLAFVPLLSGAALAGAPHVASALTFAAAWIGLSSLRGRGATLRRVLLAFVLADFAWMCLGFAVPEFELLVVHLYLASARVVATLAAITVGWHWRRRRWLWPCSALAGALFVVLFARSWCAWVMIWPITLAEHGAVFVGTIATLGLSGALALLAPERAPITHEEVWLSRAALPARETARVIVHPEGLTFVLFAGEEARKFSGLGDAMEWLRANDYMEDDQAVD